MDTKNLAVIRALSTKWGSDSGVSGDVETERKTVALNMANGSQVVTPSENKVLTQVTIIKPATLIPQNIVEGVDIGGVVGTFSGAETESEAVTVDLNLANGNQVVKPSENKLLSQVTISKPATLVPENIANGVNIGGVVGSMTSAAPNIQPLTVNENGTYTPDAGVDGFSPVTVNVAASGDDGSFKAVIERTAVNPTLPADLTKIGDYAFYEYTDLALTSLPAGVTSIGERAFYNCQNLALSSLPRSLTSIGGNAFYYCKKLAFTSLPDGVTSIGGAAFSNCENLALVSLPDGVTSIGNNAFNGCRKVALTSLPAGVTTIGSSMFAGCYALALTSLPEGTTEIGYRSFESCGAIKITSIPAGVTSIGQQAFLFCHGLTTLTFKGTPATINTSAFQSCSNLKTINVPWAEGAVSGAPWGATGATINYNYTGG